MKKALIFDPYLDSLGGGERYTLCFALSLIQSGYEVELAWPDISILSKATERFGLDFSMIKINPQAHDICILKTPLWNKYTFTKNYDLIFWISDGSLPFLFGKNNLVHLQVPFVSLGGSPVLNWLKSLFINKFVYNSEFTKNVHEKHLNKSKSFVLYPPIDVDSLSASTKENTILSVARFSSILTSKRQDVLIESFRELSSQVSGYKLILTGGLVGDLGTLEVLKKQSEGLNVEIIPNPDFAVLKSLYSKSKFFWYEIDEEKDPEKVEHFGMTTVEAMASGCIPIVINKGGQKEIITPGTGFLCNNQTELVQKTIQLITNQNEALSMSKNAIERSKEFSINNFYKKLSLVLK